VIPSITICARFSLYFSHITSPSPFAALLSTPGFCWVSSGCPALVCRGLRPMSLAFTLLIFILVFF
jgi:hypothetical protein